MIRVRAILARLIGEERAATIVEFALILPVFAMMLMGLFDMGYNLYAASVLQGAIHDAARDSTIDGAQPAVMDDAVKNAVYNVVPNANVTMTRKAYANLSDVGKAEDFDDLNSDGVCNDGEPFDDINENGTWDSDRGIAGQGNARDAVEYAVTVTYPRAFPVAAFIGMGSTVSITSTTVLRNQPYNQQSVSSAVGNCT
ncbi:TadE/TadG family type IV pilus assembly protein [Paraurantiacibacter namhicola]|uniref:TadE-like protein n=1 Tax=Paraurantiacibacter namhicola TaxID=645517 RepID=A0A1C7D997_9SPHN|nr:TadE/TadG family type IV pilus assembly protein [Paraurantiacibacter namhicola]ANU08044.1 TadE-like protein [Paraurantiacibacter namhicola]